MPRGPSRRPIRSTNESKSISKKKPEPSRRGYERKPELSKSS